MRSTSMGGLDEFTELRGSLQSSGTRCVLMLPGQAEAVLLKCPGLGAALLRDIPGIPVTSGSPMIDIRCTLTGRFLEDAIPAFHRVFGELTKVVLYPENGKPIHVDLSKLGELNSAQIEDCEFFERRDKTTDLRRRYLSERQAW